MRDTSQDPPGQQQGRGAALEDLGYRVHIVHNQVYVMHPALRHALHHWTMSLHASISLNSGFRSMPLPDEIAVRVPPPLPQPVEKGEKVRGG